MPATLRREEIRPVHSSSGSTLLVVRGTESTGGLSRFEGRAAKLRTDLNTAPTGSPRAAPAANQVLQASHVLPVLDHTAGASPLDPIPLCPSLEDTTGWWPTQAPGDFPGMARARPLCSCQQPSLQNKMPSLTSEGSASGRKEGPGKPQGEGRSRADLVGLGSGPPTPQGLLLPSHSQQVLCGQVGQLAAPPTALPGPRVHSTEAVSRVLTRGAPRGSCQAGPTHPFLTGDPCLALACSSFACCGSPGGLSFFHPL